MKRPLITRIIMPSGRIIERVDPEVIATALKAAGKKLASIRKAKPAPNPLPEQK